MSTSPELTGNAGTTYETQVAAFYLTPVLVGGEPLGLQGIAKSVALQRKSLGDPLDDIVVEVARHDGAQAKLQLQAKSRLRITAAPSNRDFREIVAASWEALSHAQFRTGHDRVGAVTQSIGADGLRSIKQLTEGARASDTAAEFAAKIATPGQVDSLAKTQHDDIGLLLKDVIGRTPSNDELWHFFRHFLVLQVETSGEGARDRHAAVDRLALALVDEDKHRAADLFDALEARARTLNARSGKHDADAVLTSLAGRFRLRDHVASDSLEQRTVLAREAARRDIEDFKRLEQSVFAKPVRPAFSEKPTADDAVQVSLEDLAARIRSGKDATLLGQPGAGKSTALLHLADELLSTDATRIPAVILLQEFQSTGLLEEVLRRPSMNGFDLNGLRKLADAGRLVLLCDGWNEIPHHRRSEIRTALDQFKRTHPQAAVVLASRNTDSYPVREGSQLFWLAPFSRGQQLAVLSIFVGDNADALLERAEQTAGLQDLVSVPFYLAALGRLNPVGDLPSTKEQIIGALIAEHEHRALGRDEFNAIMRGVHSDVLRRIAGHLVGSGTTTLREFDLRAVVASASEALRSGGQIGSPLEPASVIGALVDHHILVRAHLTADATFAFPHEQIQEWLASPDAGRAIQAASSDADARDVLLNTYLNDPRWSEPVLFAAERLGRQPDAAPNVARAVAWTLAIDPHFAASILSRAGDAVWAIVQPIVAQFLDDWRASDVPPSSADLVSFITETGRPELGELLWDILRQDSHGEALHSASRGMLTRMLLPDWDKHYSKLPTEVRRALLYDLVYHGAPDSVEVAVREAVRDDDFVVLHTVVDSLIDDASAALDAIVDQIRPAMWAMLAARVPLRRADENEFGSRLLDEKIRLVEASDDPAAILPIAIQLAEVWVGFEFDADKMIDACISAARQPGGGGNGLQMLHEQRPDQISQALAKRLVSAGAPFPHGCAGYIDARHAPPQPNLLELAMQSRQGDRSRARVAGRLLTTDTIRSVLTELIALDPFEGGRVQRERYQRMSDALDVAHFPSLLEAAEAMSLDNSRAIGTVAYRLFRWKVDHRDDEGQIEPGQAERLSALTKRWCESLRTDDDLDRSTLSTMVNLIGAFKLVELFDEAVAFIRLSSDIWQRQDAEFRADLDAGRMRSDHSEARTSRAITLMNSLVELPVEALKDALLGFIDDPYVGERAAFALQPFASDGLDTLSGGLGRPPYRKLSERRADLQRVSSGPPNAIAALLLERAQRLIESDDPRERDRGVKFTIAATTMNFGDQGAVIDAVLRHTATGRRGRSSILHCLQLRGATVPTDVVQAGLEGAIADVMAKTWSSDNDWWEVREWMRLTSATDTPEMVVDAAKRIEPRRRIHFFDDVVHSLGFSAAAGVLGALRELAEVMPDLKEHHGWLNAFVELGTNAAFDALLDTLVAIDLAGERLGHRHSSVIEGFISRRQELLPRLLARADWTGRPKLRETVAQAVERALDEPAAISLFEMLTPTGKDPLFTALLRGLDHVAVAREEIDGNPGWMNLVPVRVDRLRQRLFDEVRTSGPLADRAAKLLHQLEATRRDHGRPSDELRHPASRIDGPWPPFAASAWAAAEAA